MHSTVGAIFARAPGKPANPPPSRIRGKRREGLLRIVRCRTARLYLLLEGATLAMPRGELVSVQCEALTSAGWR